MTSKSGLNRFLRQADSLNFDRKQLRRQHLIPIGSIELSFASLKIRNAVGKLSVTALGRPSSKHKLRKALKRRR